MLSRHPETPLGEAYKLQDTIAALELDDVTLETFSSERIAEEQTLLRLFIPMLVLI